jgi:hypothetical protein
VPPTISAIGRAMSEKLIAAPPIATVSTSAETKNCTIEDDESVDTARSWPRTMSSYSCMCLSTATARVRMLSTDLLTWPSVSSTTRHSGIILRSKPWRSALAARYASIASLCALTSDLWMSSSTSLPPLRASISATASTARTQPGASGGTSTAFW